MRLRKQLQKRLTDYDDPQSLGSRFRSRRLAPLKRTIEKVHRSNGTVRIIDLGGRANYWDLVGHEFLKKNEVQLTLVNLPTEKALKHDQRYHQILGDACHLPNLESNSFDIVHSNSVIEHVGDWKKIKQFANEARRLAPYHFIQTPYYWFPIEPHYMSVGHHWLPWPARARRHRRKKGDKSQESFEKGMQALSAEPFLLDIKRFSILFSDSVILKERVFGILVKSLIAFRAPD